MWISLYRNHVVLYSSVLFGKHRLCVDELENYTLDQAWYYQNWISWWVPEEASLIRFTKVIVWSRKMILPYDNIKHVRNKICRLWLAWIWSIKRPLQFRNGLGFQHALKKILDTSRSGRTHLPLSCLGKTSGSFLKRKLALTSLGVCLWEPPISGLCRTIHDTCVPFVTPWQEDIYVRTHSTKFANGESLPWIVLNRTISPDSSVKVQYQP